MARQGKQVNYPGQKGKKRKKEKKEGKKRKIKGKKKERKKEEKRKRKELYTTMISVPVKNGDISGLDDLSNHYFWFPQIRYRYIDPHEVMFPPIRPIQPPAVEI